MRLILALGIAVALLYARVQLKKAEIAEQKLDEFVSRQMLIDNGIDDISKRITDCQQRNERLVRMMWGRHKHQEWYLKLVKQIKERNDEYGIGGN